MHGVDGVARRHVVDVLNTDEHTMHARTPDLVASSTPLTRF